MKQVSFARLLPALFVSFLLWVGACKPNSDAVVPVSEAVRGTWRYVSYTIDPAFDLLGNGTKTNDLMLYYQDLMGPKTNECFTQTTLTFDADGNLTGNQPAPCTAATNPVAAKATWVLTGTKLTVKTTFAQKDYDVAVNPTNLSLSYPLYRDFDDDGKSEQATLTLRLTKL